MKVYIALRICLLRVRPVGTRIAGVQKCTQMAYNPMGYRWHTLFDYFGALPTRPMAGRPTIFPVPVTQGRRVPERFQFHR